jgi:predicted dehydrogenase
MSPADFRIGRHLSEYTEACWCLPAAYLQGSNMPAAALGIVHRVRNSGYDRSMIRIGLLGASRIARVAIIAPARDIAGVTVTRVAARSIGRAREYADKHGIADIESDYAALVASDDVDLVYNALPPSEHAFWTIAALGAGKHVLCEKPFAMNADEARAMVDAAAAAGMFLMEAFHYRFHPLFSRIMEILQAGEIGSIKALHAHFRVPIAFDKDELRYRPELGGGAMMDLGCYPVHWVRTVMGSEPRVRSASVERHAAGVDVALDAELDFAGDVRASVQCAMSADLPDRLDARLELVGDIGRLVVDNPLAPHVGHELVITTATDTSREEVHGDSTYHCQLQHVVDVINDVSAPLLDGADATGNMRVLDAIYEMAGMPSSSRMAGRNL